ncbi:regucalcin-like [Cylas formicarius]|uniref:regucalcin-like n=1 Tax=Cylas formicarius TaxID=197179 RepID=UPI0029585282|nr:regucalcin-like [Cylas formicarius]
MAPVISRVTTVTSELGEAPHWDEEHNCLYFVDILGKYLQKYNHDTNKVTRVLIDGAPSIIVPVKNHKDHFVISKDKELLVVKWDDHHSDHVHIVERLAELDEDKNLRFNDGKCDTNGRLWIGSMDLTRKPGVSVPKEQRQGSLMSFKKKMYTHLNNIGISNGIAIDPQREKLYYIDSDDTDVLEFDIDIQHGVLSNQKVIFSFSNHSDLVGKPDGMTIDSDGNLWIANFLGGRVIKIDPRYTDKLLQIIDLPAQVPTSVAFGGKHLNELYVTTASYNPVIQENLPTPANGSLYRITGLGVKGLPAPKVPISHFVAFNPLTGYYYYE